MRKKFFFIFFAIFSILLKAENFRVDALHPIFLEDSSMQKVFVGINDAVSIFLPEDRTFVKGIELSIKIPQEIVAWRDSIAYSFYEKIFPRPNQNTIDYEGTRKFVDTLPTRHATTIFVPFFAEIKTNESPYPITTVEMFDFKSDFVFFRLQLVMKGVPESFEKEKFEISAKPVFSDEGRLILKIYEGENLFVKKSENQKNFLQSFTIFVDEKAEEFFSEKILKTGEHFISIVSEQFRNETRTFRIDRAKNTMLEIELKDATPMLKILAPTNTEFFLDDVRKLSSIEPFAITQGEHKIRFKIGDYEVVKTMTVKNGRSYTVSLSIDAVVTETENFEF